MRLELTEIARQLRAPQCWFLQGLEETASTNSLLSDQAAAGAPSGTVVFAENQTHGRGQRGNVWQSPAGKNLLFSILLRPDWEARFWSRLTFAAGLAVCRSIENVSCLKAEIKWPNDVYISGKKVAGLLLECAISNRESHAIIGLGVNINATPEDFSPEIRESATSLKIAARSPAPIAREEVAAAILNALDEILPVCKSDGEAIVREVEERHYLKNQMIMACVDDRWIKAKVCGLNKNGELMVEEPGETRKTIASAHHVRLIEEL